MRKVEDTTLCSACGGRCCQRAPGICTPSDILRSFPSSNLDNSVHEALNSGYYRVDYNQVHDGVAPLYYILPTSDPICVFLDMGGCILSLEERPTGCSLLVPSADRCIYPFKYSSATTFGRLWRMSIDLSPYFEMYS